MKRISLTLFVLFGANQLFAQNTMSDLFAHKAKLVFLGVDFTQAKYIGRAGFTDPDAIKNQHMVSWNNLIEFEPKKFSLQKIFGQSDDMYLSKVEDMIKLNKSVDVAGNIISDPYSITEDQVKKSVAKYSLSEKSGIGIVYVAESLFKAPDDSKEKSEMTAWVTFIDLSSKKVLYTEKVQGKAGGFGFRNFWAGAIYQINKEIESKLYKKWSKTLK
jgi:hypothetical protein